MANNIGIEAKPPKNKCDDKNCPFHGNLNVKTRVFVGTVIRSKSAKTANVEWTRKKLLPKFERHEIRRSRITAHNPPCINAKVGDKVKVVQTRPISKTKKSVIVEVLGKDIKYQQKIEGLEEGKVRPEDAKESKEEKADDKKNTDNKPKAEAKAAEKGSTEELGSSGKEKVEDK